MKVKENSSLIKSDYNTCIQYKFENIYNQAASIILLSEEEFNENGIDIKEKWDRQIKGIKAIFDAMDFNRAIAIKGMQLETLSDFGVERFAVELDFNDLLNVLKEYPIRLNETHRILRMLIWNRSFVETTGFIDTTTYSILGKYESISEELFSLYFSRKAKMQTEQKELLFEQILTLYFGSVFKAILSLDKLIDIANDAVFNSLLKKKTLVCKMRKPINESYYSCRLLNCKCAPLTLFDGKGKNYDNSRQIDANLKEIIMDGTTRIINLILEDTKEGHVASIAETKYLFDRISKRIGLWKGRRIPDTNEYINECPDEIINNYCKAFYIRRKDVHKIRQLIYKLYRSNPFMYDEAGERGIYYYSSTNNPISQVTLQSLILNASNADDLVYIFLNSHLKLLCGIDSLIEQVSRKNTIKISDIEDEIRKSYSLLGVIRKQKLYSAYLDNSYDVEYPDGVYRFELDFGIERKVQVKNRVDIITPQVLLMQIYILNRYTETRDEYCKEYFDKYEIHNYADFCSFFKLVEDNYYIFPLYKIYFNELIDKEKA